MNPLLAGLVALLSICVAWAQVAVLQIRIVEGDGAVHSGGSRASRPIVVEVTDETGRPAAGAAISFHLPDEGPGGVFTNGLHTEVVTADGSGRAVSRSLQLNRQPGRFQIRITASLEQARAGTLSYQYIAETGKASTGASTASAQAGKGRKWWVVAALAGAGVAAGGFAARGSNRSSAPPVAAATLPPAAIVLPSLSIGTPKVTVGRP